MKFKTLILGFLLVLLFNLISLSQQPEKVAKASEDVTYKILTRFPVNVSNKYVYTEKSKISRIFSNGNNQEFEREIVYHYSMVAPSAVDKEGFQVIDISVDSLQYTFKKKDTVINFNSQSDDMRPPKIDDYQMKLVPLGLNFQFTYSPYQEVAKVGGDMLNEKRNYLTDPKTAPSDEINKFTWLSGLSDESLMILFDVVKGFPPESKIAIDSVWTDYVLNGIEGAKYIDSVEFKLTNFNIQSFTIKGESKGLKSIKDQVRLFGLSQLIDFSDITGKTEYTIKMHPRGSVNHFDIKQNYEIKYEVAKDILIQKVETHKTWYLEKMYNW